MLQTYYFYFQILPTHIVFLTVDHTPHKAKGDAQNV